MILAKFTSENLILPALQGTDSASVISELTQRLHGAGIVSDSLGFYHAVLNREFMAPTHVSAVVAFPHARSPLAARLAFAVGRSAGGVTWGPRGEKVRLVFLIAIPPSSSGEYLGLMAAFAAVIRDAALRDALLEAGDARGVFEILSRVNSHTGSAQRATAEIDR